MKVSIAFAARKIKPFFFTCLFIIGHILSYGQACNCPALSQCSPCQGGGLTSLTFRYNGVITGFVIASDQGGQVYANWVAPGNTFTVTGSLPNNKFKGNELSLLIPLFSNNTINTSCTTPVYVGSTFGVFTVVSGLSNAGAICCTAATTDNIPPTISNCPSDIQTVLSSSGCAKNVTWTAPTASDNCGGVILNSSNLPNTTFPKGTTIVTYTATDDYNNTATCTFKVIVKDQTKPTFAGCITSDVIAMADASCQAKVAWTPPTATDNCDVPTIASSHKPNDIFPMGTTTVVYTAKDDADNTATCTFKVIVRDITIPTFSGCVASDVLVTATSSCEAIATWTAPTTTDNCGSATITSSHNSGAPFPVGTTNVKYTATDAQGNVAFCQFKVIVKNGTLPTITNCPQNVITKANESGMASVDWILPTAASSCGEVTLTSSHIPGESFRIGTTEVKYTATDNIGGTTTCKFNVIVAAEEIQINISKVITPDGNGINDEWIVADIEKYKENKIVVVDRWGSVIYSASGYDNKRVVWKGENGNGTIVPTGTYFYSISVKNGPSSFEKSGFIELIK